MKERKRVSNGTPGSRRRNPRSNNAHLKQEPIAIVGVGCRFPGANGPDAFWRLLRDGVDAITEIPADRFDIDAVYDPHPGTLGKIYARWGGFLEDVDQFDPYFFGISPREAARMDPQQRLLLEVTWEALEDAGEVPGRLAGSRTGVFIGMCYDEFASLTLHGDPASIDIYSSTGSARSVTAGRLSYVLSLQGPSVTVDTACSSSLVAVHLACQSLWNQECTLALAGGVNFILQPHANIAFSQAKILAPDGRCKAFDARADGFVRSDGVGVVVLKPLSQAQAEGDPIYAVILGSAVNNDGRSGGLLMTPSRSGQEEVLREAYRVAGVSPGQVHYVEAHGTGTSVGDPIEAYALGAVLSEGRPQDRPCIIGSVKTNIGHTEGAAGVAGLIKAALCLKHRAIPPNLHVQEPNPNIPWQELRLVVQRELGPWPADSAPALAGVSSFGISGTNAHVVLQEAPPTDCGLRIADCGMKNPKSEIRNPKSAQLLPLSAHTPEALEAMVKAYKTFATGEGERPRPSLQDICYTASIRRTHHDHRLALVAHSLEEVAENLDAFLEGAARPGLSVGQKVSGRQRKLVFVFPGQGSQWVGMGRELLAEEPVFRETLERCEQAMRPLVDWSLLAQLAADEAHSRFDEVDVIQPTLFAIQVALAALWRSWGIEPDAVVGQSMGEVAAAYVAGALRLDDAARIICRRSQLVKSLGGKGGMAVVGLSLEEARRALTGYEDRLSIAVSSSPSSTVLSGDAEALKELADRLERQDILCRLVKVDYASHSFHMDPLRDDLLKVLERLQPRPAQLPMYSTVTGEVSDGLTLDATYWWRNLREPVLFSDVVQQLMKSRHDIFLEISPHPVVSSSIQQVSQHLGQPAAVLPSLRRAEKERAVMLGSFGTLYTLGYPADWAKLYPSGGRCVRLPNYPWQRERFWPDDQQINGNHSLQRFLARRRDGHPLLGQCLRSAAHTGTYFWEMELSPNLFPFLDDHRIQGMAVLPAAVYVDMALAAAQEAFGPASHVLEKVAFRKALFLPNEGSRTVQLVISPEMPGTASFQFFSLEASNGQPQGSWTLHATGTIRLGQATEAETDSSLSSQADRAATLVAHALPETIQARCAESISGVEYYQAMQARGVQYGPSFQGVDQIWRQNGEAIGRLSRTPTVRSESNAYQVHPALLDSCFQVLAATLNGKGAHSAEEDIYLPTGLGRLRVYNRPGADIGLWSHALLRPGADSNGDALGGDVFLLDESGQVVVEALDLRLQRLEGVGRRGTLPDLSHWLYELLWQPKARPQSDQALDPLPPDQRGRWLIFTDSRGVGQTLRSSLEACGETCVMVSRGEAYGILGPGHYQINPARPEDFRELIKNTFGSDQPPRHGVVHLWSLETAPPEETTLAALDEAQVLGSISVLHLVQALVIEGEWGKRRKVQKEPETPICQSSAVPFLSSPRLWLVTGGSQKVGGENDAGPIGQSPLWGLGRVITQEHPELPCTLVDLSSRSAPEETQSFFQEVWIADHEDQIALRGRDRYVLRLVRYSPEAMSEQRRVASGDQPFRLEISTPGILDNLTLRAMTRKEPGPGMVEIQVYAAGLNFSDVMKAMGIYPGLPDGPVPLGVECAGKIAAVGEGVEDFQVGDEVMAIAPFSFASHVLTSAAFVVHKPSHLSFEEAATIPIAFLTAYYALHHLGRLSEGERVLIHAAAGGVGVAAIQLAQRVGAEIFATAGNPEKREFLRSLGVSHVMDSRSLDFADEVKVITEGKGVDVVLNSLAGDAMAKSLSVLGAYGRFLEIGKRDIYQNSQIGLQPFQNNLSFFAIDLDRVFRERPHLVASLFREVMQYFEDGSLKPIPSQVFPISQVESAFRLMAQAKHIGKIVVSLQEAEVLVAPASDGSGTFRADGTYLITGGLGGLGLLVAQWMVKQGARHLILMGRSGASPEAEPVLETMREAGAEVVVARADVSQEQPVANVLAEMSQSMPPLKGIIHSAGLLDDSILLQMDQDRFKRVLAPKVAGAWNLHNLTLNASLDFFVLFSSGASLLGSAGQANYVAANAFLDSLAQYRRAQGLPALTINWGYWAGVGMVARDDRAKRLEMRGVLSFEPDQGLEMMQRLIQLGAVQVAVIPVDWAKLRQFHPTASHSPLLADLLREYANLGPAGDGPKRKGGLSRDAVLAAEPDQRQQLLETYLSEQIARVLGLSESKLSKLDVHQPLTRLGIDSLMAVELKNRVESDLGVVVPVVNLLNGPNIADLGKLLLEQLMTEAASPAVPLVPQENPDQVLAKVDQLSDEEVDSMLHELLNEEEVLNE